MKPNIEENRKLLEERIWAMEIVKQKMEDIFFKCESTREFLVESKKQIQLLIENDF